MGVCFSSGGKVHSGTVSYCEEEEGSYCNELDEREWETLPTKEQARSTFNDGSMLIEGCSQSQLEFRRMLEYSIARQYMQEFLDTNKGISPLTKHRFKGWLDMQVYKKLPQCEAKLEMMHALYRDHEVDYKLISTFERAQLQNMLSSMDLSGNFNAIQMALFGVVHDDMYILFRQSSLYKKMVAALRRKYNKVRSVDFDFLSVLGEGGFGLVVSVRKRSTGEVYAMKIQRKFHLFEMFGDEKWRANFEKEAFASFQHPFIVELFYAFQTKSLVALVMSHCSGSDLSKILRKTGVFSADQVRFYSAEITAALRYLHMRGFIYRDLKPGNVLLNNDGHIKLVDFGSICDVRGTVLGLSNNAEALIPLFSQPQQHDHLSFDKTGYFDTSGGYTHGSSSVTNKLNSISPNGTWQRDIASASVVSIDDEISARAKSFIGTFAYMVSGTAFVTYIFKFLMVCTSVVGAAM
jgi:hypothetical protein